MNGVFFEIASKSSIESSMPISRAIASRCSTALVEPPLAATLAIGVHDRGFGDDLRGAAIGSDRIHQHAPGFACGRVLVFVGGRNAGKLHGRNAQHLAAHGHGVCGELAAARAGTGAGIGFEGFKAGVVDLAGSVRADAFEDVLNRDVDLLAVGAVEFSRSDGAAVEHHAGNIEAAEGHDDAGHVLVASADADEAVEEIAARDEFDGVGDHFARDQRSLHTLRAHGDAVGDGDGVELHGRAAGFANAFFESLGYFVQVDVAGADLGPRVGDADDRLVQIVLCKSRRRANRSAPPRGWGLQSTECFVACLRCVIGSALLSSFQLQLSAFSCAVSAVICDFWLRQGCRAELSCAHFAFSQPASSCFVSNVSSAAACRRVRPMSSSPSIRQNLRKGSTSKVALNPRSSVTVWSSSETVSL